MEAIIGAAMNFIRSFTNPQPTREDKSPLRPSYADVCVVRAMLQALNLPTELVLEILEYARYWPSLTLTGAPDCQAVAGSRGASPGRICLDHEMFPENILKNFGGEKVKIKELVFDITSHDQGWTSEGTVGMTPLVKSKLAA